ncbi:MAG TPA: glycosyltransferase family A protein [Acetobacteraceae bacterium]|nr:glycosyltransferase family A protein [Acetobacteraceae bacterium]
MRFSLVIATLDRTDELAALLGSLAAQSFKDFELIIVDQNADDRLVPTLAAFPSLRIRRLRCSVRALSLARNYGLAQCNGDLVGFPDDDCLFPPGTLTAVDAAFRADAALALLSGPAVSPDGALGSGRWSPVSGPITVATVWTRVIAFNMFIRRDTLSSVGGFDETLGVGARFGSAEETDLAIRVIQAGNKAFYDTNLHVIHPDKRMTRAAIARAFSYGTGLGRVLRKHRVATHVASQFFVRPTGGILLSLARLRPLDALYYWKTLQGRLSGYFANFP